jgi:hypothetical protein
MGKIVIEQLGGIAGIGDPMSALQRSGEFDEESMTDVQKVAIDQLFGRKKNVRPAGNDRVTFKLTRQRGIKQRTISVSEDELPESLQAALSLNFR